METTIDAAGRVVVPKRLRDQLGLTAGTKVDISRYGAGLALTPSVAVPLLHSGHDDHATADSWAAGQDLRLPAHARLETYSVLTRLPKDARVHRDDAVRLLSATFTEPPLHLPQAAHDGLVERLSAAGVVGGAVHDGLVALTAAHHELRLASMDARAQATYAALGVDVMWVAR